MRKILPERIKQNFGSVNVKNVTVFFIQLRRIFLKLNHVDVQDAIKTQNRKSVTNMDD